MAAAMTSLLLKTDESKLTSAVRTLRIEVVVPVSSASSRLRRRRASATEADSWSTEVAEVIADSYVFST